MRVSRVVPKKVSLFKTTSALPAILYQATAHQLSITASASMHPGIELALTAIIHIFHLTCPQFILGICSARTGDTYCGHQRGSTKMSTAIMSTDIMSITKLVNHNLYPMLVKKAPI
eukprot:scaffold48897_cov20-Prasinocladus_malaysianus.AAC.1